MNFVFFENKDIRAANNVYARRFSTEIYNFICTPIMPEPISLLVLWANLETPKTNMKADYAWVYFSLSALF
jgi:hypothetical protein